MTPPKDDGIVMRGDGHNFAEVVKVLSEHPAWDGMLAYDKFALRVMLLRPVPRWEHATPAWALRSLEDVDVLAALAWFHTAGMVKVGPERLRDAMVLVAHDNAYHPVLDYFERICAGDAPPAIPSTVNERLIDHTLPKATPLDLWLTLGFGAKDNKLTRAIARRFMIALVRRVRRPGCQQDYMLVLHSGEQGVFKSTGLRTLVGGEWFADGLPDIGNKDAAIQLHGKVLLERGEIELLTKRDKAFISRVDDRFRPPWGRSAVDHPRTCSFAGTTNFSIFADDASGARRLWPVEAGHGDRTWLGDNRDLIWRLAGEAEALGESSWLDTKNLQTAVRARQDDAQKPHIWTEHVLKQAAKAANAAKPGEGFTVDMNFIAAALGIDTDRVEPKKHDQAFTDILIRAKYRRGSGRRRYNWFAPNQLPFDNDEGSDHGSHLRQRRARR